MLRLFSYIVILIFGLTGYQPNGQPPISCTDKAIISEVHIGGSGGAEYSPPHRLSVEEISQVINDFRIAAKKAIEAGKHQV